MLREAVERHPEAKLPRWLLARAYLKDGNDAWALRTLLALAEIDPRDCEPGLWAARIYLKQGAISDADERLKATICPAGTPAKTRELLLLATVEHRLGEQRRASQHLADARRTARIYTEDRPVLDHLTSVLDPGYIPFLAGRLDLAGGWTSNARAGSPTDPATLGADASSPAGQLNAWLQFVAPTGRKLRPSLELEARALGYTAQAGRGISYLTLGGRPGILVGNAAPNALLAYRFEALLLAGGDRYGDGPIWFYNVHRAELEINVLPSLTIFAGTGRRLYRETGRSRIEADGGLGGGILLRKRLRLLGALTARWNGADKPAYDLWGGSLLLSAELRLPRDWALRVNALTGLDWYPHSAGYFDATSPGVNRRDVLLKLSASGFSPTFWGMKAGVTYEYAERFSTTAPYSYRDHRVLARLTWHFAVDPWAPKAVSPEGHVPLDHGIASSDLDERLQDLLRQDDAAQRSSSCVE